MPSLSDNAVQNAFVHGCTDAWDTWAGANLLARSRALEEVIATVFAMIPIPALAVTSGAIGPRAQLSFRTWTIEVRTTFLSAVHDQTEFGSLCSTIYHEMRHGEQWFRILQGSALELFTIPSLPGTAVFRIFNPLNMQDLADGYRVPLLVATQAIHYRNDYPRTLHDRLIRGWYRSIYGYRREHRAHTIEHMVADPAEYRNLPEEVDAYRIQGEIYPKLLSGLRDHEMLAGVAGLFDPEVPAP